MTFYSPEYKEYVSQYLVEIQMMGRDSLSYVCCNQIHTGTINKLGNYVGHMSDEKLLDVEIRLQQWLGLIPGYTENMLDTEHLQDYTDLVEKPLPPGSILQIIEPAEEAEECEGTVNDIWVEWKQKFDIDDEHIWVRYHKEFMSNGRVCGPTLCPNKLQAAAGMLLINGTIHGTVAEIGRNTGLSRRTILKLVTLLKSEGKLLDDKQQRRPKKVVLDAIIRHIKMGKRSLTDIAKIFNMPVESIEAIKRGM